MGSRIPVRFALVLGLTLGSAVAHAQSAAEATFRAELALRHAPIHHQDVHVEGRHALGGAADYITAYDFDGDWDTSNNWDHAGSAHYPLAAHAYYSVVETSSHWFITYSFFHPRDWSSTFFETEHENDSEGVLLAVARDGSRLGALRAAVTVVHADFYSYVPGSSRWTSGQEDVDGKLSLREYEGALHPVTAQQAETHALKAWPYYRIEQQGVVYYPSLSTAEVPSGPNDRKVLYQLHDLVQPGGLWPRRQNLLTDRGEFPGNRSAGCGETAAWCVRNAAHAAWAWDDHDDQVRRGAIATDPATLVRSYFTSPERIARRYSFNPFR